ncbi:DUF3455 domain-containing protein [Nitrincola tapanii]|nr:DUF3455 domain-containing protein [Nitrincola tapanii]
MYLRSALMSALLLGSSAAMAAVDNASLPEAVQAPAGQVMKLWTLGEGEITYACREKADEAGAYAWVFVAPVADLTDAQGEKVGTYYNGPTWEALDGSIVTGKQLAVAPAGEGNIPLQLVEAMSDSESGLFSDITYIQRLNTKGGVAPAMSCDASSLGQEQVVTYAADYVFYIAE